MTNYQSDKITADNIAILKNTNLNGKPLIPIYVEGIVAADCYATALDTLYDAAEKIVKERCGKNKNYVNPVKDENIRDKAIRVLNNAKLDSSVFYRTINGGVEIIVAYVSEILKHSFDLYFNAKSESEKKDAKADIYARLSRYYKMTLKILADLDKQMTKDAKKNPDTPIKPITTMNKMVHEYKDPETNRTLVESYKNVFEKYHGKFKQ